MTGFGEASAHIDGVHYAVELRSLNGKYFKATVRLPEDLQSLEPALEASLRKRLTRGTVTAIISRAVTSEDAAYTVNTDALERYIEQIRETPSVKQGHASIDIAGLLLLPGVLRPPTDDSSRLDKALAAIEGLLDGACEKLIAMREREGVGLRAELRTHANAISERLEQISKRAPLVVEEYNERLRARVASMLEDAQVTAEPGDMVREVAIFADRSDIAEEIARLRGHMEQFEELIDNADNRTIGRTLDFLTQEMLREANTIGSKSGDSEISRDTVEIKSCIDRIKEQVQNVE
jgi:uncharacterized protein (TIGR00255 family)